VEFVDGAPESVFAGGGGYGEGYACGGDGAVGEDFEGDAHDDGPNAGAAARESPVEVAVLGGRGGDVATVGSDDFPLQDVVRA
jgi:hypothetical protein